VGVWHAVCVVGGRVGVEVVEWCVELDLLVDVRRVEDFVLLVGRLIADCVEE